MGHAADALNITEGTLRCQKCREVLPAEAEFFYRDKNGPGGWRKICKACYSETPCIVERNLQRAAAKAANAARRREQQPERMAA
jgi:hypothetical protein